MPTLALKSTGALATLVCMVLVSCQSNKPKPRNIRQLFQVRSYIDTPVSYIKQTLGKPDDEAQLEGDGGVIHFTREDYLLGITYDPASQKPTEFFIGLNSEFYPESYAEYLTVAGLPARDSAYTVIPIRSMNDTSLYTGINVIPRPKPKPVVDSLPAADSIPQPLTRPASRKKPARKKSGAR